MRTAVGGPPHSGKSVFVHALMVELQQVLGTQQNLVAFISLDLSDNTFNWLLKGGPRKNQDGWTSENLELKIQEYERLRAPLVIADAPGLITPELRRLLRTATSLVIVSGNLAAMKEWEGVARDLGIEVIASILTSLDGTPGFAQWDHQTRKGRVWGLKRDAVKELGLDALPEDTRHVIGQVARMLLERI